MLAESPRLGPLISEDRSEVEQPYWLRKVVHAVLNVGPADGRRTLRAQSDFVTTTVIEGVHLFLNNVCLLTNAVEEQTCIFKNWGIYTLVSVKLAYPAGFLSDPLPEALLRWQDIFGSSGCLEQVSVPR